MLKVVSKRLETTKAKVSKEWQRYRRTKLKVNARKTLSKEEKKQVLASERDLTRQKISEDYLHYREFKHAKIYKSEFEDFNFTRKINTINTTQKIFKARKYFDTDKLDDIVDNILTNKKVKGVLVVFEMTNEQGIKSYISNYVTTELLDRIMTAKEDIWGEGAIFDYVTERLNAGYKENLQLRFIYMRIIYENS